MSMAAKFLTKRVRFTYPGRVEVRLKVRVRVRCTFCLAR